MGLIGLWNDEFVYRTLQEFCDEGEECYYPSHSDIIEYLIKIEWIKVYPCDCYESRMCVNISFKGLWALFTHKRTGGLR